MTKYNFEKMSQDMLRELQAKSRVTKKANDQARNRLAWVQYVDTEDLKAVAIRFGVTIPTAKRMIKKGRPPMPDKPE